MADHADEPGFLLDAKHVFRVGKRVRRPVKRDIAPLAHHGQVADPAGHTERAGNRHLDRDRLHRLGLEDAAA